MKSFSELAQSVTFATKGSKIVLNDKNPALQLIGEGRSAFAFRIGTTNKVLKVFFPPFVHVAKEEALIYQMLKGVSFFPTMYESGPNYIVIDFIEGETLYNCLVKGLPIASSHIKEIDKALFLAEKKGLNPSDIHLRNIFITTSGEIKIIDVARYRQIKNCNQWDDLKKVYDHFYKHPIFPKRLPQFLLNLLANMYKKNFFKIILELIP